MDLYNRQVETLFGLQNIEDSELIRSSLTMLDDCMFRDRTYQLNLLRKSDHVPLIDIDTAKTLSDRPDLFANSVYDCISPRVFVTALEHIICTTPTEALYPTFSIKYKTWIDLLNESIDKSWAAWKVKVEKRSAS